MTLSQQNRETESIKTKNLEGETKKERETHTHRDKKTQE